MKGGVLITFPIVDSSLYAGGVHGYPGLEKNCIHPDERNADDADYADTRGLEVSIYQIFVLYLIL
jgi:hypothetical protein